MNNQPHIIIRVDRELAPALAQANYGEANAVCTLLVLKALDKSGIHAMRESVKRQRVTTVKLRLNIEQRDQLMKMCLLSAKQIDNHVEQWIAMKLACIDKADGYLRVASYDEICKYFGVIKTRSAYHIKHTDGRKLIYIIKAILWKNEVAKQKQTFIQKVRYISFKNNDKELLECLKKGTSSWSDRQIVILQAGGVNATTNDIDWLIMQHRAQFDISTKTATVLYGYSEKNRSSVANVKRRMTEMYLAQFHRQTFNVDCGTYKTDKERKKEKYGEVWFCREAGKGGMKMIDGSLTFKNKETKGELRITLCDRAEFFNHNEPIAESHLKMQSEVRAWLEKMKNQTAA